MDLVTRITRALDERRLEPGEFERAACALLQPVYPGLSAVEGGHDFGRDGDVYFPLPASGAEARGRLMVTTGDPVANMRRGLQRLKAENQRVDLVVMACSGPVDARTRATLERLCDEHGVVAPHIYARTWLVNRLATEPTWRERLTGVRGHLGSLLDSPLNRVGDDGLGAAEMFGRDAERAHAQELVDAAKDFVVVGQPGVGKTRLVQELQRVVKFLEAAEPGQVLDDLLMARPAAVVVDDAHVRLSDIDLLRRARRQEGLSFSIVATTWPDRLQEVVSRLPAATELSVPPIERGAMDALLQSVGVTGHQARASILMQARGRPGWALALCDLLLKGDGYQVATGRALVANVERFLLAATTSEAAVDVLACIAALGHADAEDIQQLASLVGMAPADISGLLYRLAHNGLLDQAPSGWSLQPVLRGPLVARWFFTSPARRTLSTLDAAFPGRPGGLAEAVLLAAHTGSEEAQRLADAWADMVIQSGNTTRAVFNRLELYATLNEHAGHRATQAAVAALQDDPHFGPAHSLASTVVRRWALPEAVRVLLDAAIGDTRPRHQTPDHPLRVLKEAATRLDPDGARDVTARERILDTVLDWLTRDRTPERWLVTTETVAGVLSPELEGTWPSLSNVDAIVFGHGVASPATLRQLIILWSRVPAPLDLARSDTGRGCPPEAIRPLIDLAGEWVRLGRGSSAAGVTLHPEQVAAGIDGGRVILQSLQAWTQTHPGLALRADRFLKHSGSGDLPGFDADVDLVAFVGSHRPPSVEPDDLRRHLEELAAETRALATRLACLGPADGVARFAYLTAEARHAGHEWAGSNVAGLMAPQLAGPVEWYLRARDADLPHLMQSALAESLSKAASDLPADVLQTELAQPQRRPIVIASVLSNSTLNDTVVSVVDGLQADDARLLSYGHFRDTNKDILYRLLTHPVPEIAAATALQFDPVDGRWMSIPDTWRTAWRNAFLNLRADQGENNGWHINSMLKGLITHDQDLAAEWYERRLSEFAEARYLLPLRPCGCEKYLASLTAPLRARLIRQYLALDQPRIGHSLLTQLLGNDATLAEDLLNEGVLFTKHLLQAIAGGEDAVDQLGPLLLRRGVTADLIADAALPMSEAARGDDIQRADAALAYYKSLGERVPALIRVAEIGIAAEQKRLLTAENRQQQARLRGEYS
ncbi:hypothetical protein F4560_001012 [Saccharothrix ecbatanensis]|uniref:Uncharacterized protein n=1 Tax=Saccharothrix ecbatanensis TaxID=1105145 RepID=A0A7W9HFD5_9PSEU|nr:ATP-binding protein [Saccharothrix ecbatanensis]MBB5801244.1 hypothetical protein [Saccharothrix ecbatanensis]